MNDGLGKQAETKIKDWLDHPERGYAFTRLYDQMTGFYQVSRNPCDFIVYKQPNVYYIESKALWGDRFDFINIQPHQMKGLMDKSKIPGVYGLVIVLFATYHRAFAFHATDINRLEESGVKSVNITKIDSWKLPYKEIRTIDNPRKKWKDYEGDLEEYI